MADNVTGADLVAKCQKYGEIDDNYWDVPYVLGAINDAITEMWDRILATTGGADLLLTVSSDLTVTSGTATVALPADAGVEIRMVEVKYGNDYRPLRTFNMLDRADGSLVTVGDRNWTEYRIVGQNVLLSPTPLWDGFIRVWYVPLPTAVELATSHNFFFGWDRFVWNKVCSMHARARGEDKAADNFLSEAMMALTGILSRCKTARTPQGDTINDDYARDQRNRSPYGWRT